MDKTALVTGSSRGIGNAIAQALLNANFHVIGTSRSSIDPFNNPRYQHISVNLGNEAEVVQKLKTVIFQKNGPEVIINNAGIFEESSFTSEDQDWINNYNKHIQVNLLSPSLTSKWAIESWLINQTNGVLINISSRAGSRGDTQEYAAYAATKGALNAFTKSIARSYGKNGITAYTISPGFVRTDMAINSMEVYGEDYLTKDLALNEIAPPEDIAELCLLLASGKLKHATGQNFHVNSGSYLI